MGLGRRKVGLSDPSRWVFNRMADVYDARPPYPEPLVDALCALVSPGAPVLDVGAGIGHLTLPLARRGLHVHAVEPARAMLDVLEASACGLPVTPHHATAEALPLAERSVGLAVVADALHFLDAALTGRELGRVLAPGGALSLVTCGLADTPFMNAVVRAMEEAAPRRPRATGNSVAQVASLAGVELGEARVLRDDTALDGAQLLRIMRSISFIGPAMNAERFAAFSERVLAIDEPRVWSRTFTVHVGRRRG